METRDSRSIANLEPKCHLKGDSRASETHPSHNEDRFFVTDTSAGVFDGVGGDSGSERAADLASSYCQVLLGELPYEMSCADAKLALEMILTNANIELQQTFYNVDIKTTAVIAVQHRDPETGKVYLQIAHTGDSRAYVIRNHQIHFVTLDHALTAMDLPEEEQCEIQMEVASAHFMHEVDPFYWRYIWERNIIGSCLSSSGEPVLNVSFDSIELQSNDFILLTSDGIHDNLTDDEILGCTVEYDTVKSLINKAVERSNEPKSIAIPLDLDESYEDEEYKAINFRSKHDDMTAVAIRVGTPE